MLQSSEEMLRDAIQLIKNEEYERGFKAGREGVREFQLKEKNNWDGLWFTDKNIFVLIQENQVQKFKHLQGSDSLIPSSEFRNVDQSGQTEFGKLLTSRRRDEPHVRIEGRNIQWPLL